MKSIFSKDSKITLKINLVLIAAAGIIIILLIIGTIYALVRPANSSPLFKIGNSTGAEETYERTDMFSQDIRVFPGIGRLRIALSDSSTMVVGISFPYAADDTPLSEEIDAKINDFRDIAIDYFSSLPTDSLTQFNEDEAKREILKRYNSILRLGRLETLYFTDLMIFDSYSGAAYL